MAPRQSTGGSSALLAAQRAIDSEDKYRASVKKLHALSKIQADNFVPDGDLEKAMEGDTEMTNFMEECRIRLKGIAEGNAKRMKEIDYYVEAVREVKNDVVRRQHDSNAEDEEAEAVNYEAAIHSAIERIREKDESNIHQWIEQHPMVIEVRTTLGERVKSNDDDDDKRPSHRGVYNEITPDMTLLRIAAALLSACALAPRGISAVEVDDMVCMTGYIMDNYCIFDTGEKHDRGTVYPDNTFLDAPTLVSLQNPQNHSFHCLLDVPFCYESGYVVLGPMDPATDRHTIGYRLQDTEVVRSAGLAAGQSGGYCTDCLNPDSGWEYGYQATVKGRVVEVGDGTDGREGAPLLTDIEMLDYGVSCDAEPTTLPVPEPEPEPEPLPALTSVQVDDEVCMTGYIMDNYCIFDTGEKHDRGTVYPDNTFLDAPTLVSLQNPQNHSFHCLLDVSFCYESGYVVLGPKDPATDRHTIGYRIDDTDAVRSAGLAAGKSGGYCTECTNPDSDWEYGYQATIKGKVLEVGDGTDGREGAPLLTDVQVLDYTVSCDHDDSDHDHDDPDHEHDDPDHEHDDPDHEHDDPDTPDTSDQTDTTEPAPESGAYLFGTFNSALMAAVLSLWIFA